MSAPTPLVVKEGDTRDAVLQMISDGVPRLSLYNGMWRLWFMTRDEDFTNQDMGEVSEDEAMTRATSFLEFLTEASRRSVEKIDPN